MRSNEPTDIPDIPDTPTPDTPTLRVQVGATEPFVAAVFQSFDPHEPVCAASGLHGAASVCMDAVGV